MFGIGAVQLIAVLIGGWIAATGLSDWMPWIVGITFVTLGVSALVAYRRGSESDEEDEVIEQTPVGSRAAFFSTFGLLFAAELGDKTMFTTAALASVRSPWAVFVGAAGAFAVLAVIATAIGASFAQRLDERLLTLLSGIAFVVIGAIVLATAAI